MIQRLIGCILLLVSAPLSAKDLTALYDERVLRYWKTKYKQNIIWNFENPIWQILTPEERQRLAGVQLLFPLRSSSGDPMDFYSDPQNRLVYMPVMSIKFFDDLAVAYAWLGARGCDVGPALKYVGILKYRVARDFPNGRYAAPIVALGIPGDVLENRAVNEVSQKILKSGIIWILAHELGHVFYRHPGYGAQITLDQVRRNEIEADEFASQIMRRLQVAPVGMAQFFTTATAWFPNRADFDSPQQWERYLRGSTHPLTPSRMRQLAVGMTAGRNDGHSRRPYVAAAGLITDLADSLSDPDLQILFKEQALATQIGSLRRMCQ